MKNFLNRLQATEIKAARTGETDFSLKDWEELFRKLDKEATSTLTEFNRLRDFVDYNKDMLQEAGQINHMNKTLKASEEQLKRALKEISKTIDLIKKGKIGVPT